jgi:excinuclease ABC subunit B
MGRAARHVEGQVILYADKMTDSMTYAIEETKRRRRIQEQFNTQKTLLPLASTNQSEKNYCNAKLKRNKNEKDAKVFFSKFPAKKNSI